MLIIAEQTTFEPYIPERYSKSKDYILGKTEILSALPKWELKDCSKICKNCHQPFGKHMISGFSKKSYCPTTYILK